LTDFRKNTKKPNSVKIYPVEAELFKEDGRKDSQSDRQTDRQAW